MHEDIAAAILEERITLYCKAWGKSDHELQRSMLDSVMESSARYRDPKVDFMSVAELSNYIGQVHSKWPGARIVRTSVVDVHHNVGRFAWQFVLADGAVAVEGLDFVEFSARKISRISGFFGPMQPLLVWRNSTIFHSGALARCPQRKFKLVTDLPSYLSLFTKHRDQFASYWTGQYFLLKAV